MSQCNHEEADTRIVKDSLERGDQVHTVDTDVVVVLIGEFYNLQEQNPNADIWVGFGTGKHFRYYHINTIWGGRNADRCLHFMLSLDMIQLPLSSGKVKVCMGELEFIFRGH